MAKLQQAVALHQQGRLGEAEALYREVIGMDAKNFDALHLLGVVAIQTGRPQLACDLIGQALTINRRVAEAHSNYGAALKDLLRHEDALASYDRALRLKPGYFDALYNRGLALQALGRPQEALASFDRALGLRPDSAEALNDRGIALQSLMRTEESLACFESALRVRPSFAEALYNQGNALQALQRPQEAIASYEAALRLRPGYAEALNNCGAALQGLGRLDEALESFERSIAVKPDQIDALFNCGNVLVKQRRAAPALAKYEQALRLDPSQAKLHNASGVALQHLRRYAESLACFERALQIDPRNVEALNNKGAALLGFNRLEEALANYAEALKVQPGLADTHWNEGMARLVGGDFAQGWPKYEWRWQAQTFASPKRDFQQPLWLGKEPLQGKTILLHAEQGLGDAIQFCRYAKQVAALGATVLLEVQTASLKKLLAGLEGVSQTFARGEPLPSFDCHCPLLSLPLAFNTERETIPAEPCYIAADPDRAKAWRAKLGDTALPSIGVVCVKLFRQPALGDWGSAIAGVGQALAAFLRNASA